jgi:hypothetical protein
MDPILAAGVVSLGRELVQGFLPQSRPAAAADFQQVLNAQQVRKGGAVAPGSSTQAVADPRALARRIRSLEISLGTTPEVAEFTRGEASFKLRRDDSGFLVERSDGSSVRLAADSPAGKIAEQLDTLRRSQREAAGLQATTEAEDAAWLVTLPSASQRSSRV